MLLQCLIITISSLIYATKWIARLQFLPQAQSRAAGVTGRGRPGCGQEGLCHVATMSSEQTALFP